MARTTFLVDGFNIYHSVKAASRDLGGASTKWLDLRAFLSSYLAAIGNNAQLREIYYFTALGLHMDARKPGTTTRHKVYMECLTATGVRIELGRFKRKDVWCQVCRGMTVHYEEKETDVAIATKLLELFHDDACDVAVIVTGDTDLAPVLRTAQRLYPAKSVCAMFPYKRKNSELAKLVSTSIQIRRERYAQHQLPNPYVLPSGRQVPKPPKW
jgi:uncharacterized LabA/DUF88 family protein